jgi:hypothetical protein
MFYVYKYLREDGTPYYIGKGKNGRAWFRGKNERIRKPKDAARIVIVAENLTEDSAFDLEKKLIAEFGRKDLGTGILHNITDGGEGASGAKFGKPSDEKIEKVRKALMGRTVSTETKEKMSQSAKKPKSDKWKESASKNRKGKSMSEEQRKLLSISRMGENNPMFGKESPNKGKITSEETKSKIREARAKQIITSETREKMSNSQKLRHASKRLNTENKENKNV